VTITASEPISPERTDAQNQSWKIMAALAAVYLIWGSTYFGMRVAIQSFPPLLMGAMRFGVAGTLLFGLLRLRGAPMPTRRQWVASLPMGLLLPAMGNGLVAVAQQWVASSIAAVIIGSMPLWTVIFASLWGVRPRAQELLGIGLGTLGIVLLNLDGNLRAHPLAALLLLLSPIVWAFGSVWSRRLPLPAGPMASALQMMWGSVFLTGATLLHGDHFPASPTAMSVAALVYLTLAGSMVAYSAFGFLLQNVRPALATSYAYVNPVVALLIGWTFGAERLGLYGILGTLVILTAVLLVARSKT
jgi:drug/metabolite transporter (DMT)-like permease